MITRQDHLTNQEVSSPLEGGDENYSNDITGVNLVFGLWRQQTLIPKKKKLGCRVKHELNRLGQFANPFLTYIQMNTAQKYVMFCVVNTSLI